MNRIVLLPGRYSVLNHKEECCGVVDIADGGRITFLELSEHCELWLPGGDCLHIRMQLVTATGDQVMLVGGEDA